MPTRKVSSSVEGFGISFIEAASYGISSIGGKDGGSSDAIYHNKTGLICDGTDLNDIYNSVTTILENEKFIKFGKEEKIYPYNELVMDNFTIQRVIYNYMYKPSEIENVIGEYLSREEIEAGSLEETEILKYFKKWVSGKVVSTKPKYPVVDW